MPLKAGDQIVSFLPMAHVFGLLFEFLFPVSVGCHITFLSKAPTPQLIIKAFQEIKPRLILSVPLVIEKIYKKRILQALEKPDEKRLKEIMAENCKHVNRELPKFARLSSIILVDKEFDKTPKRNIKRYLYT